MSRMLAWFARNTVAANLLMLMILLAGFVAIVFGVRREMSLRQWAETYIKLTAGPLVGNSQTAIPWSCDHFPLQRTLVEALDNPHWSQIVIMTPPQAFGKTVKLSSKQDRFIGGGVDIGREQPQLAFITHRDKASCLCVAEPRRWIVIGIGVRKIGQCQEQRIAFAPGRAE